MSWRPSWWLNALKLYWPLNHIAARATSLPLIGPVITKVVEPLFNNKNFNISYIPINAKIDAPVSTILTQEIIADLIRSSSHRVVIKRCSCRDSRNCQTYPAEDSCLLLGESTKKISPEIANHISVDQALEHMHAKINLGLIPLTGRVRMDDLFYGVPNQGRMLTICFCCPCCCTVLRSAKYFPQQFRASILPLKGLQVKVDGDKCIQCNTCMQACFMDAITLVDEKIIHDATKCIGCGRCSMVCPQNATMIEISDSRAAVDELLGRISQRVNVK
ncbi:4Fe-4S dicluster domain-containing protein [bacterium]|nr:4Fe-4S dicluster domain-containing protein [bacterium]